MSRAERSLQIATSLLLAGIGAAAVLMSLQFPPAARLIPSIVASTMSVLALIQAVGIWMTPIASAAVADSDDGRKGLSLLIHPALARRSLVIIIASAFVLPLITLVGYALATSLYIVACLIWIAGMRPLAALAVGAVNFAAVYVFFKLAVGTPAVGGALFSVLR